MKNIEIVSLTKFHRIGSNILKTEYLPNQSADYHTFNLYLQSLTSMVSYYYGQIFISKDYTKIIKTCSLGGKYQESISELIDFLKELETL